MNQLIGPVVLLVEGKAVPIPLRGKVVLALSY